MQIDFAGAGHAESIIRMIEASMQVRRRHQFFVWSQHCIGTLLPHHISVCGAYQRARKQLVFEPFYSVPVSTAALAALCDGSSALMQQVIGAWIDGNAHALLFELRHAGGQAAESERDVLIAAGFTHLLVHGVMRPGRPTELESMFILSGIDQRWSERERECLDMMLPYLHSTYLRVQHTEREMNGAAATPRIAAHTGDKGRLITERERQILSWVREGKSNMEIGIVLEISALTVKNHVQKILRKLGAANRAQAVAKAMSLNLLGRNGPDAAP